MDAESKHWRSVMASGCQPVVFKHTMYKWPALQWTPESLSQVLGDKLLDCKISLIQCEEFQWEADCLHLKVTMKQYVDWLQGDTRQDNPLRLFDISKFSCYIDYKYMKDMFKDHPDMLKSVCWDVFGLNERDGEHSTIWIGSGGTYTPCHQDTYGFNLVAQIQGRKRWYLFNPDQTDNMYPTRIPYEESSIYSEVNVRYPDLETHPLFQKTTPYVIELVPGDVLYVPNHWWHFVESLEPSISINTWVPFVKDSLSQLDEAVCRLLYTCLSTNLLSETERLNFLNTGEKLEDNKVNLQYIQRAVQTLVEHKELNKTNSQMVTHNIDDSCNRGQKEKEGKLTCDHFEKFLNKFQDYSVTVSCLCGVELDMPQNLDRAGATKRKTFYNETEVTGDQWKVESDIISDDRLKTVSSTASSEDVVVNCKRPKVELDVITNDNHKTALGASKKSVTDENGPSRMSYQHANASGDSCITYHCGIEIFAAKCFTFNKYLRFLKIVFDYESNYKLSDCMVSDLNGKMKPETHLSSSKSAKLPVSGLSRLSAPTSSAPLLISSTSPLSETVSSIAWTTPSVSTSTFTVNEVCLSQLDNTLGNTGSNVEQNSLPEKKHAKYIGSDFKVKADDEIQDNLIAHLNESSATFNMSDNESCSSHDLTLSTADIINSILDANVIRHIGQILLNKYKK